MLNNDDISLLFLHVLLLCRVYGVFVPPCAPLAGVEVDLIAATMGGVCLGYSNAHYGHPRNIIR